jgi:4-carboxymuconolactone decarboxylase
MSKFVRHMTVLIFRMVGLYIFDFQNDFAGIGWLRQSHESIAMTNLKGMGQRALGAVPALADLSDRVLFGEVWERGVLGKRDRSLVTVACLIALGRDEQLPLHLETAIAHGITGDELREVVTHLAFYAGWPAAATAARLLGAIESDAR